MLVSCRRYFELDLVLGCLLAAARILGEASASAATSSEHNDRGLVAEATDSSLHGPGAVALGSAANDFAATRHGLEGERGASARAELRRRRQMLRRWWAGFRPGAAPVRKMPKRSRRNAGSARGGSATAGAANAAFANGGESSGEEEEKEEEAIRAESGQERTATGGSNPPSTPLRNLRGAAAGLGTPGASSLD